MLDTLLRGFFRATAAEAADGQVRRGEGNMTDSPKEDFYIAFTGDVSRVSALSRFFDRLAATKAALLEAPPDPNAVEAIVKDSAWIDLLDVGAFEKLTGQEEWQLEDILQCVLNGEYHLVGVSFDGRSGRLVYDPWAYPFGGTDPLKALVRVFGLEVVRDSFWDGFAEWQRKNAGPTRF
jgi:hypothetical protein